MLKLSDCIKVKYR